jgi:hypothetical protein
MSLKEKKESHQPQEGNDNDNLPAPSPGFFPFFLSFHVPQVPPRTPFSFRFPVGQPLPEAIVILSKENEKGNDDLGRGKITFQRGNANKDALRS